MYKLIVSTILIVLATTSCTNGEQVQPKNAVTCQLCTFVFTAAGNLVQNNATDQKILEFLENSFCGLLGPYEATCKQLITTFGPEIIADLANKVDPAVICKKIGFCTSSSRSFPKASPLTPRSLNCTICKLVMTEVQMQLKNNVSEQQIIHFIEGKLCDLAGPLAPLCKIALESFGPQILTMLANGLDPEKACEFLQMCQSSTSHHRFNYPSYKPTAKENPVLCTICQYVVEYLDTQLRANKTEEALVAALDQVCKLAPSSLRDECNNLVNQYGIYLVQLVTEFADPLKVCRLATLC
jgi:saposin